MSDSKGPGEGREGWHGHHLGGSDVDYSSVVSPAPTTTHSIPCGVTEKEMDSSANPLEGTSSLAQNVDTHGGGYLRESVEARGISGKTCDIICASWRATTHKQYNVYIKKWKEFCIEKQVDPLHSTVDTVLGFLTKLFELGLGYSVINTARSALSAYTDLEKYQVGNHPSIMSFVKGSYQLRTPLPKYYNTWDVAKLLNYFKEDKDNDKLDLKDLTRKLCALLLIASAQRVQTIHLIKLSGLKINVKSCIIPIVDKLKSTRPSYHQKALEFDRFEDERICVVNCLEQYIRRTEHIRKGENNLILSYSKPHKAVSKDTMARWMKELLTDAGIEGFEAHSFRSAAASDMYKKGVPLDSILQKAGWSNARTFHKFYNRDLPQVEEREKVTQKSLLNYFK